MSKKEKIRKEKQNTKILNLTNNNNGITLIALVITIIVLLILAGVTINLTLGENGIFRTAEMAGKNYTQAQGEELAGIANFENEINNIIGGTDTPGTNDKTLASKAKPGDYVRYIPAEKTFTMKVDGMSVTENGETTEYTQAEHGIATGYDTEQNFNTADYTGLWQVLYNDEEHGLQIISADVVTDNLTLGNDDDEVKAKIGYNNVVDTLNGFCSNYVDTRYATSGRSVGSDPINPKDTVTDTVRLDFEYNGSRDSGCKGDDFNYRLDHNAMKVATSQNQSGINDIDKLYWLTSRYMYNYLTYALINVCLVDTNGEIDYDYLWSVKSDGSSTPKSNSNGVRPVITLKPGIQTSAGDGSEGSPYELVAM